MQGISIRPTIGIGDALQFSSLPENYFRAKGAKLYDVSKPWFFDHNPFVERHGAAPAKVTELWNFSPTQYQWPRPRVMPVYLANAEVWSSLLGVPMILNRPRLYQHEDFPYEKRETILLQTHGKSHGAMPDEIVQHVIRKYGPTGKLFHIGPEPRAFGMQRLETPTLWALAAIIAQAKMVIGLDSGPAMIAQCYPDVVVKKLRTKPNAPDLKDWVPLAVDNIHSFWDDRAAQIFNVTDHDIGFTQSWRKI